MVAGRGGGRSASARHPGLNDGLNDGLIDELSDGLGDGPARDRHAPTICGGVGTPQRSAPKDRRGSDSEAGNADDA